MEEAVMAADRMWVGLGEKRRPAEGRVVETATGRETAATAATAAVEMAVAAAEVGWVAVEMEVEM
eukprot:2100552-Prymnesium_polylepis.1